MPIDFSKAFVGAEPAPEVALEKRAPGLPKACPINHQPCLGEACEAYDPPEDTGSPCAFVFAAQEQGKLFADLNGIVDGAKKNLPIYQPVILEILGSLTQAAQSAAAHFSQLDRMKPEPPAA